MRHFVQFKGLFYRVSRTDFQSMKLFTLSTLRGIIMINVLICDDYRRTLEILMTMVTKFYQNIDFKAFKILTFDNSTKTLSYIRDNRDNKFIYILDIDLGEKKVVLCSVSQYEN